MTLHDWFTEEEDTRFFDQYVTRMEEWLDMLVNGHVALEEIKAQALRVVEMLQQIEERLSMEERSLVTRLLLELTLLHALESTFLLQHPSSIREKRA